MTTATVHQLAHEQARRLPATRASDTDKADVRHFITQSLETRIRGGVTGAPVCETDDILFIRMYSAGCLHNEYGIVKAELLDVRFPAQGWVEGDTDPTATGRWAEHPNRSVARP